ncbi:DinB family protein [Flavihumibacter rivuli]|uniref:DinB family protein n=1 Tax=Flavihumibacter rivuli TaxID=2838156 RepID=UPI001BDE0530|nr:DinB family protein [Flavihumibacter rivuli]ULQ56589.1 DinB family protein [Flavihumibacter rivuli]
MPTSQMLQLWEEGRTRFSNLLSKLTEDDLKKKLVPSPNSAGFLLRHIADVELLFAKNVFGVKDVEVHAKTVIAQKDTGEWTELAALIDYQSTAFNALRAAILSQTASDWEEMVTTKEWGTKTKAEALGRIISHTTYHAGQLAMIIKYGES